VSSHLRTWPGQAVLRAARWLRVPTAALAALAVLAVGAGVLAVGAGVASDPAGASTAAGHVATRNAPALLPAFRVDVSRYPQVGLVVTVPAGGPSLTSSDFTVMVGTRTVQPSLRYLSPGDIQLVLAPATDGTTALAEQGPAAASFLVNLPHGAQTGIVDPSRAEMLAGGLTTDPTTSVAGAVAPASGAPEPAAARLTTALSAFSPGVQVRRTVVLVIGADETLSRSAAQHFRQQLAAGGTALYVLDASPDGAAGFDALAAASGGFATRLRAPADWRTAFSQIIADLGQQYYLRFIDPVRLPGLALIAVTTRSGVLHSVVQLPAANPIAPPPLSPVRRIAQTLRDWPLVGLGVLLIVLILCYGLGMLAASRRNPRRLAAARQRPALAGSPGDLFFVFLLPCLNEEKVILNSLQRLLSMPRGNFAVLVIDDDSDDRTVEIVSSVLGEQAWLLQRTAPDARQGKGEALNAAVRHLTASGLLDGRDPGNVIVVVVDADGRLDPHAVAEVTPYFADPMVGAVQIGVRINNRTASRLARMQDMEFVIYTEVFQRGRRHLGSVGLGGNGQFMRLSALRALGPAPWTRSLTEDLDLGIRLLAAGWRNEYCPAVAVHQQGVVQLRRLIRQRSRWFQGHLQAWKLIPSVLRNAPRRARADLLYHLSSPAILLIASLLSASFLLAVANDALVALHGRSPFGWWLASTYALTFGPALVFSSVYWARERQSGVRLVKVAGFAHLYVCYSLMWYVAGWWAVGRTLRRRTSWTKTERVTEAPVGAPVLAARPATSAVLERMAAGGARPAPGGVLTAPATSRPAGAPAAVPAAVPAVPAAVPAVPGAVPAVPGAVPAVPGAGQRGGRRRRRPIAVAAAVVLAGAVLAGTFALSAAHGKQSQWYSVFNGYGVTTLAGSGARQVITLSPGRARTRADTHAALVLTKAWYQDFVTVLHVRTVRQLRQGAAGSPNPWEVGWVVWHYTSNQRFYALTLEPTGWVLSKQDPSYKGGERFLASSTYPRFPVGVTHTVGIVQIGNQITVSADGHLLTQFTDVQRPYLGGGFGVYSEDSVAQFSHIQLSVLRNASSHPVPMPAAQQKPAIRTKSPRYAPARPPSAESAVH
jgi:1,2-diacylglycerol 3-beta-glucosyltransferase